MRQQYSLVLPQKKKLFRKKSAEKKNENESGKYVKMKIFDGENIFEGKNI